MVFVILWLSFIKTKILRFFKASVQLNAGKSSFDNREVESPLEEDAIINDYGNKKNDALIVVVPTILDDSSRNKRQRILTISDIKDEKDDNWTKWIQSIQNSKVYFVQGDNEKWLNDDECIQIKRMTFDDDKCIQFKRMTVDDEDTVSVFEHRYEQTLDVVKLPMPIPECLEKRVSQFLFLRPDDYVLFYCIQKQYSIG
jgi:hypothetical protein